jgi:hypothetical protein
MTAAMPITATKKVPMDSMRKTALVAGVFYLITFISIPTLALYGPVKNHIHHRRAAVLSPCLSRCIGHRPPSEAAGSKAPIIGEPRHGPGKPRVRIDQVIRL